MALGFIKKVFTFGKEKPVAESAEQLPPSEATAITVEDGPHQREEVLPVSPVDPVAPVEMETAGGPSSDGTQEPEGETGDSAAILPGAEETFDLGVVPLSLLEAEAVAAAGDVAKAP